MEVLTIIFAQFFITIVIMVWAFTVTPQTLYLHTKTVAYVFITCILASLILFLASVFAESWLSIIFLGSAGYWFWMLKKISATVPKTVQYIVYIKYKEQPLAFGKNVIELKEGEHFFFTWRFRLGIKQAKHDEKIVGFDTTNHIITIDTLLTVSSEPVKCPIHEIEVGMAVDVEKLYQLDFFEYKGLHGQAAAVAFIRGQISDVLKQFISSHKVADIKTPELIRTKLEEDDHRQHKHMVDKINEQLHQFKVRRDPKDEEHFASYKVERIKIGDITLPPGFANALEDRLTVETENATKAAELTAMKSRSDSAGIPLDTLNAIENDSVKKIIVGGTEKITVLVGADKDK